MVSDDVDLEVRKFLKKHGYPQPASSTYERLVKTQMEVVPKAEYDAQEADCCKRIRDKNDAHVLAAFKKSSCDYLVTGDNDLLALNDPKVITTRRALQLLT